MAKHISTKDIDRIVTIIDGATDKLSWSIICESIVDSMGFNPTRQTLTKHQRIKEAYDNKKNQIKSGATQTKTPPSIAAAAQRIARLKSENERLKKENSALLEQFLIWQYNAYSHGITEDKLNLNIPGF
jgi:hypothetical protein